MAKLSAYDKVTERMVALLESGVCPWRQSWSGGGGWPISLASRKRYRGVNVFLLACCRYSSPYWLTFNQAKQRGGSVRKGEKGMPVVFWHFPEGKGDGDDSADDGKAWRQACWLRGFTVFNVAQCDGLEKAPESPDAATLRPLAERIDAAERLLADYAGAPQIKHGFDHAGYVRDQDVVRMPEPRRFKSDEAYYCALFHELAHSTGSPDRLNRVKGEEFGDDAYAREELVAELTAAMLCAECGIAPQTEELSAAYLNGWARVLKGDSKLIVNASSAAQKAADMIRGVKWEAA